MDDKAQIYNSLVRLQAKREHCRHELIQKLSQKGYARSDIEDQIEQLTQQGLQCDQRYVEMTLRVAVVKGHGLNRLRQKLSQQQLEPERLKLALQSNQVDWFELAYAVKCKKFSEQVEQDWAQRQRQQRFLLQRGFSFDEINYAVSHKPVAEA